MDVQRGTSGAHRIVVMRTGRTEKRHHGVTNVLVDRTPISDDNAVDEGGIAAYQLADLFRIERSRYCGESTEISEENGDLPTLAVTGGRLGEFLEVLRALVLAVTAVLMPT
jgi:hypothetical protein